MFGKLRICNVRLTNGLRRIFDPLAALAGLALSAFALEYEINAIRFRAKYVAASENGECCQ